MLYFDTWPIYFQRHVFSVEIKIGQLFTYSRHSRISLGLNKNRCPEGERARLLQFRRSANVLPSSGGIGTEATILYQRQPRKVVRT